MKITRSALIAALSSISQSYSSSSRTVATLGHRFEEYGQRDVKTQRYLLPSIPYDYAALEPFISETIMRLHHSKHHAAYTQGLNDAEDALKVAQTKGDVESQLDILGALKFNGGGYVNHSIFWKNMMPPQKKQGSDEYVLPEPHGIGIRIGLIM